MDTSHIVAFLQSRVELFKNFPDDRLQELVEGSTVTTFEPNEAIIRFAEDVDDMARPHEYVPPGLAALSLQV